MSSEKPKKKYRADLSTDDTAIFRSVINKIVNPDLRSDRHDQFSDDQQKTESLDQPADQADQPKNPSLQLTGFYNDTPSKTAPVSATPVSIQHGFHNDTPSFNTLSSQDMDEVGYTKLINSVLDTLPSLLSANEMMVYLRLYRLSYGFNKARCIVGMKGLVSGTRVPETNIHRALTKLELLGLIKIIQVHNGKGIRGTEYEILAPTNIERVSKQYGFHNDTRSINTPNKEDDHDDLKKQNHHQATTLNTTSHENQVMMIYEQITGNFWSKADHTNYEKIKNIPIEKIEVALRLANDRASNRPNSFAFFIKEIIASVNPKTQSRSTRKKAMARIVERVRNSCVGSNISPSEFVYKVKELCLRDDVAFDNDLLDEVLSKT
ncbi:MAG: replication protein [Blastocatellia bacterium]